MLPASTVAAKQTQLVVFPTLVGTAWYGLSLAARQAEAACSRMPASARGSGKAGTILGLPIALYTFAASFFLILCLVMLHLQPWTPVWAVCTCCHRVAFSRPFQHPYGLWALDWCSKQRLVGSHKHTRTLTGVNRCLPFLACNIHYSASCLTMVSLIVLCLSDLTFALRQGHRTICSNQDVEQCCACMTCRASQPKRGRVIRRIVLVCCSGAPAEHHRCLDIDTTLFDA